MPEANWIEARRPSCGRWLIAGPEKDNFGLATWFGSFASFASFASSALSDAACTERDTPSWHEAGDFGEGEEAQDGGGGD